MTASDSRDLPPLPQDPPTTHATIGSPVDSNNGAASVTDTESYSRRSKIRTRSRSFGSMRKFCARIRSYDTYQLLDERRRISRPSMKLGLFAMQDAAQAKEDG